MAESSSKEPATLKTNLHVIQNAVLQHSLGALRSKDATTEQFRIALRKAGDILAAYVLAAIPTEVREVETPIKTCTVPTINEEGIVIVPILRAGLAFAESFIHFLPNCIVGHIGLARDHVTLESRQYYEKLPPNLGSREVFILDPMLATGNSCLAAYRRLQEQGVRHCTVVSLLAAPEGIALLNEHAPEVNIFTASIDEGLNEKGYIVPGLGDAGDRFFGV